MIQPGTKILARKDIRLPDLYIRTKGADEKHLETLRRVVLSALGDGEKMIEKPTPENWPLEAITVWKTEPKRGREYEIIEGVHRYMIADEFKLTDLAVVVRKFDSLADARLAQLTENSKTKLGVDFGSRNAWITMLCAPQAAGGMGMKQEAVAKAAGLSEPSVSRILAGTQTCEGRKKATKKKKKKEKDGSAPADAEAFDALSAWYGPLN